MAPLRKIRLARRRCKNPFWSTAARAPLASGRFHE